MKEENQDGARKRTSITISMTSKIAEAAENIIRSALDAATGMGDEEWDLLDDLCERLSQKRGALKVKNFWGQQGGERP